MDIRFVSRNQFKIDETLEILKDDKINIVPYKMEIEELQTLDVKKLVKDKLLKAFYRIGRPVFVEHTGLYIEYLNAFPGGLTQIFWDSLKENKFSEIIGGLSNSKTIAQTTIGYCDGKQIHYFNGCINGIISEIPKGKTDFQWDCVFIPEGETLTFSEMGLRKNEISMRKKALMEFKNFITT